MKYSIQQLEMHLKNSEEDLKIFKDNEERMTEALALNAGSILQIKDTIENLKTAIDLLKKHEVK